LKATFYSRKKLKDRESAKDIYEYELKEMYSNGLTANGISDILSCVDQKNYVDEAMLREHTPWLLDFISRGIGKNDDQFYSWDIEAALICLRYMIELGVFGVEESEQIIELIKSIVKRISQSLQLQNETKIVLKSNNFKELLLEMVEKNVIKRFNYSAKFDGIEDQVTPQNICSEYVNYAFYQNILLLEKNTQAKRK
jgi:hypothetical protein